MGYQTNFNPIVELHTDSPAHLRVGGSAEGLPEGDLTSRTVTIAQGDSVVLGLSTTVLDKWSADLCLNGAEFHDGDCIASGIEVYAIRDEFNPSAIATTATVQWSQNVAIETASDPIPDDD